MNGFGVLAACGSERSPSRTCSWASGWATRSRGSGSGCRWESWVLVAALAGSVLLTIQWARRTKAGGVGEPAAGPSARRRFLLGAAADRGRTGGRRSRCGGAQPPVVPDDHPEHLRRAGRSTRPPRPAQSGRARRWSPTDAWGAPKLGSRTSRSAPVLPRVAARGPRSCARRSSAASTTSTPRPTTARPGPRSASVKP